MGHVDLGHPLGWHSSQEAHRAAAIERGRLILQALQVRIVAGPHDGYCEGRRTPP